MSKYIVAGFWGGKKILYFLSNTSTKIFIYVGVTVGRLLGPTAFVKINEKVKNMSLVVSALTFVAILWGIDSLPAKAICTSLTGVCWGKYSFYFLTYKNALT